MLKIKGKNIPIHKIIFTLILFFIGITMLAPLAWMISTSFKPENDVFDFPIRWVPEENVGWANYQEVWGPMYNFGMYYWNSIKITVVSTVFQILISALGAYGFTKVRWKHRDKIFLLYLASMMIPPQVMITSRFVILQKMGLYNTHLGIILMTMVSTYGLFLLRQAMLGVPDSLCESAKIDGAGNWHILRTIIMPLSVSALSVLSILLFITAWSDYLWPLVIATSKDMFVLEIGLTLLQDEYFTDYGQMMAGCAVALVPAMLLFIFFRRHIMEGIAMSGIKG